jgi:hypothetical protein
MKDLTTVVAYLDGELDAQAVRGTSRPGYAPMAKRKMGHYALLSRKLTTCSFPLVGKVSPEEEIRVRSSPPFGRPKAVPQPDAM